jgi:putative ABC transport system permease protein
MNSIVVRSSRNYLWQHPWQLALAILGIALGVAVVIAIDLAMESSLTSFYQASKVFSETATHRIIASDGGLDEKLYTQLRVKQGINNLSPLVTGYVTLAQSKEENFKLVGIDPFIEKSFYSGWQSGEKDNSFSDLLTLLMTEPNSVLISEKTAQLLGKHINDRITVVTGQGEQWLKIIGFIPVTNAVSEQVLAKLIISDIATAQELLDLPGRLSSIDVLIAKGESKAVAEIQSILPGNALIVSVDSQEQSMREMTRAFSIDLKALALLSLLVGMFLIYNTMTFLILQRRRLIGSLRLLGVTRKQIFKLILGEAFLLATIGTLIGIVLGIVLGQGLLVLIAGTINDIYFRIDRAFLTVTPIQLGKGMLLGLGATFLAVLPPALEATRLSPVKVLARSQLESDSSRLMKILGLISCLLIVSGLGMALLSGKSIELGLASIFLILLGFGLITPLLTLGLMNCMEGFLGRFLGILGRLPVRMVSAEISRTGIAIAALMIAVAATIGMDLMIGSVRQTVAQWLHYSLPADLYISLPGDKSNVKSAQADYQLKGKIADLDGVQMLSSVLQTKLIADGQLTKISLYELNEKSKQGFIFKHKVEDGLWHRFENQKTVFVTEPYAFHQDIQIGQSIQIKTDKVGEKFEVIGITAEYSGDQGHLVMSRQNYLRFWPDLGYTGVGVYASPGADLKQLENRISQLLTQQQTVKSNQDIYKASMKLFEQTFSITETLRWLSAMIAFVGVFSALMALQFERTRQLGVLRAIGITSRQLTVLIISETGLMGLVAGLLAIPIGFMVAYVLIFVVYQRSFGWTMAFYFDWTVVYQGLMLAFVAALLAGVFPAIKMARTQPAEALCTE